MTKFFSLASIGGTPEHRRGVLLHMKKIAKKAGLKCKIYWDAAGLHIDGTKALFETLARELPRSK